mgnify:CR=1 FL=1
MAKQVSPGVLALRKVVDDVYADARKAKAEGLNVTCETGPHYLLLDDSCLQEDGRFKMNPPLCLLYTSDAADEL